jgi:hypothetical protein
MSWIVYFLAGLSWGLINLYFIRQLLFELLVTIEKNYLKMFLLALVKFPVLYGVGFGLLCLQEDFPWAMLAGFGVALAASTQKRLWKAYGGR